MFIDIRLYNQPNIRLAITSKRKIVSVVQTFQIKHLSLSSLFFFTTEQKFIIPRINFPLMPNVWIIREYVVFWKCFHALICKITLLMSEWINNMRYVFDRKWVNGEGGFIIESVFGKVRNIDFSPIFVLNL